MLKVQGISFAYQDKVTLKKIDFKLKKGQHACVIGESGCGKSTLLKAVYGLLDLKEGNVFWKEEEVLGPKFNLIPGHSKMKYLAQEDAIMPYITVSENIKKYLSRQYPEKAAARTQELLKVIDLEKFANTKVKLLSGGQKQRVALAQVLAKEPELLLLDEPFNFIDNFRKNKLRRNLFNYLKKQKITCLFATHDSTDMLGFADLALVMKNGKLISTGRPIDLYNQPPNYYIASLMQEVNLLSANLFPGSRKDGEFLIYPSELKIAANGILEAKVVQSYFNGNNYFIEAVCKNGQEVFFLAEEKISIQQKIELDIDKDLLEIRWVAE